MEQDYNKKYYKEKRKKILEQKKEYYQKNKEIINKKARKYYLDNKEKIDNYNKKYRKKYNKLFSTKMRYKYHRLKLRHKKLTGKNISFTLNEFISWFKKNNKCIYCGGIVNTNMEIKDDNFKIKSVERIDNKKGYNFNNMATSCYACNMAKGNNFSHEEMLILGKTIRKILNKRI